MCDRCGKEIPVEYYTFLHHSQTVSVACPRLNLVEYYTFLHHSQTHFRYIPENVGLNTIRFYIILKPWVKIKGEQGGLNTIRFYIILKLATVLLSLDWVEYYTFLHHSQTMRYSRILKKWVEYYTFLHHSQTLPSAVSNVDWLNTIRFYIILKQMCWFTRQVQG